MNKLLLGLILTFVPAAASANTGIWLSDAEVATLATSGTAFNDVVSWATNCGTYVVNGQDSAANVCYLANALLCAYDSTTYATQCTYALRGINQVTNQITGQPSGGASGLHTYRRLHRIHERRQGGQRRRSGARP